MDNQAFVDAAQLVVGFSANPKNAGSLQSYSDLIAPGESAGKLHDMLSMSGCGLVVAGIWRNAGVVSPKLEGSYVVGTAISRLTTLAHESGAWVNFTADAYPNPGDMVLVGDNGAGGVEHVFTIVSSDGNGNFESVDGGQRDADSFQCILHKNRTWSGQKDVSYLGSYSSISSLGGRKIIGWIDCTKLPDQ